WGRVRLRHAAERGAYLLQCRPVEPALAHAALDGPGVRLQLAGADVMVAALVIEDEQAHVIGFALQPCGIEDQQTARWRRCAPSRQVAIEPGADIPALHGPARDLEAAIFPRTDRRAGLRSMAEHADSHQRRTDACAYAPQLHDCLPQFSLREPYAERLARIAAAGAWQTRGNGFPLACAAFHRMRWLTKRGGSCRCRSTY